MAVQSEDYGSGLSERGADVGVRLMADFPGGGQKCRDWRCESDSAQSNYTNWHFTPHVHTPLPRGPIRRLPLRAGDRPDTGAACLCIMAVIAVVIFVCVFLAQTRILWSPLSLQVLLRTAFLWNHQGPCTLRRGAGCRPTQIMRGHMTASVEMATLRDLCVCVRVCVFYCGIARLSHIFPCIIL